MTSTNVTTFAPGGFDPSKPNNNIVHEETVEVPDPEPTPEERLAILEAEVRGMKERAAAEAAKSTTTAKGVATAIASTEGTAP